MESRTGGMQIFDGYMYSLCREIKTSVEGVAKYIVRMIICLAPAEGASRPRKGPVHLKWRGSTLEKTSAGIAVHLSECDSHPRHPELRSRGCALCLQPHEHPRKLGQ